MICLWTRELFVASYHTFSFVLFLPYSKFTFTYHVQPIIEEVDSDIEVKDAPNSMIVEVYDPLPLRECVRLVEDELLKTREALSQALEDCAHAMKEAKKWFLIRDYFYKKIIG